MPRARSNPVVHLELHSPDRDAARALYAELCDWRAHPVCATGRRYTELSLGRDLGGGIVECGTDRAIWLPYVEVDDVDATTEAARRLGARVLLEPREGPSGRRSVIRSQAGGEVAFWERNR